MTEKQPTWEIDKLILENILKDNYIVPKEGVEIRIRKLLDSFHYDSNKIANQIITLLGGENKKNTIE